METALEYIDGGSEINENMDGWSVKDDEEKVRKIGHNAYNLYLYRFIRWLE